MPIKTTTPVALLLALSAAAADAATCSRRAIAREIKAVLAAAPTDTDFSFFIETASGRRLSYDRGGSRMTTSYASASTSKWVTAVIILREVQRGSLSIDSRPQDLIPGWNVTPSDPLAAITLGDLLSFTSGLVQEPACVNSGRADFEECVRMIADVNVGNGKVPGAEFDYGSAHLQVAGLMAVKSAGVGSWQDLFDRFRRETGLFSNGGYDLPSAGNPRLAGGMHWTGADYAAFLRALQGGQLLGPSLLSQMYADHVGSALIGSSPPLAALGEDWHYGFGHWLECPSRTFDCPAPAYHSSPGAYGAYPFVDVVHGYFGIVARQGTLGTFRNGKALFDRVRAQAEAWAECRAE